jgi:hypothetical protein
MILSFALTQQVTPLFLKRPLAELFPAAWAGSTGYLSSMWMVLAFENAPNCDNNASFRGRVGLQNRTFK